MAFCTHHPDLATAETCDNCWKPFCANCLVEIGGKRVCGVCRDHALARAAQDTRETLLCRHCGQPFPEGTPHCPGCGSATGEPIPGRVVQFTQGNHALVALVACAATFAVAHRWIQGAGLSQTYATFVGLPLLVGVLTAYLVPARRGLGSVMKITTIILCVLAPLLGEGTVCLLMAAPLFYGVAALGWLLVAAATGRLGGGRKGLWCVVALPFIAAELTATPNRIANPRTLTVTTSRHIAAAPESVWRVLRGDELVPSRFPLFLRLGFPLPTRLERTARGVARLHFTPRAGHVPGDDLIESLELMDAPAGRLVFQIHDDRTMLGRWLRFERVALRVEAAPGGCVLTQTTTFRQRLQPGAYWNPLQEFALHQTHAAALQRIAELAEAAGVPPPSPRAPLGRATKAGRTR